MAPEYAVSPSLVAFIFSMGAGAVSFPLGLLAILHFLLGELEGPSLGCLSPITTPLAWEGPAIEPPLLDLSTFSPSFLRLILLDKAAK